jgi:hypothetical protein
VLAPLGLSRFEHLRDPDALPQRMRQEIERFFLDTTFFTQKDARVLDWKGPGYAERLVRMSQCPARRKR